MSSANRTWDRLRSDSDDVRDWLEDGIATAMVRTAKDMFGSVSYHVVTATGCSPVVDRDGKKRYPQVTPRRVLDPITYYYLMRFRKFDG